MQYAAANRIMKLIALLFMFIMLHDVASCIWELCMVIEQHMHLSTCLEVLERRPTV